MIRSAVSAGMLIVFTAVLAPAAAEQDILQVMGQQVAAWNRGDIDAFAKSYIDSPDLLFVGHEMTRGYSHMVEHYKKTYPTADKMGRLKFSDLKIQVLDPQYANVVGRFHLERNKAGGGNADGVFTLLLQKTPRGWKIIQDHTS
jgi:uncharacterized protein (TIGR02246 family)